MLGRADSRRRVCDVAEGDGENGVVVSTMDWGLSGCRYFRLLGMGRRVMILSTP